MHKNRGWTGLRSAVIALGLVACTTAGAQAAPLLKYSTAGTVNNSGITGANVISYVPSSLKSVDPSSNVPLGSFVVAALQDGQKTSYKDTPFNITLVPQSYNGQMLASANPLVLSGTLTGDVVGGYQSTVKAIFNPILNGGLTLGTATHTLSVLQNQNLLVPDGSTSLQGILTAVGAQTTPEAPVPEPSTVALFLTTVGGIGLRRFLKARRLPNA